MVWKEKNEGLTGEGKSKKIKREKGEGNGDRRGQNQKKHTLDPLFQFPGEEKRKQWREMEDG